ncbi:MAG: hypothetical protein F7B20_04305 [Aeropyrum sp.]|nr:hypothetical protein [Aeropyrum sp.]MCE4616346.1 hypothetical protein [Aeropyrum sp.]
MSSDYAPEDLRRVAVRASSETAALLRDIACSEGIAERICGETTVADKKAEDYIVDLVRSELGGVQVVSEEMGGFSSPRGGIVALIDPLDGSANYLSCINWASVSIAFADPSSGELLAGSVAPIFHGYPVSFSRGGGCYHGGRRLARQVVRGSIIAVYVDEPGAFEAVSRLISRVKASRRGLKVRSLGSAALELSYVGLGYIALFADLRSRLRNIDVAAAVGIVRECGGEVTDPSGRPLEVPVSSVKRVGAVLASLDVALLSSLVIRSGDSA